MGYRAWNNYEEAAAREYRQRLAELPLRRRVLLRLWQAVALAVIAGLPISIIARGLELF